MADTKYAPVGTRVVFENEKVRVWEIELQPGETLPMHHHELDYVVIGLTGGRTIVEWEDGRQDERDSQAGGVTWRSAPHAHKLTNVGTSVFRNRMIEVKA